MHRQSPSSRLPQQVLATTPASRRSPVSSSRVLCLWPQRRDVASWPRYGRGWTLECP